VNLDNIMQQFYAAGLGFSASIQPYALDLFWGLFFIEFLVTAIQYLAEGQLDPWYYGARLFKHSMTAGVIYLMITRGFAWMLLVLSGFQQIGQSLTGLPNISPQGILNIGLTMGQTILNMPGTSGIISNFEILLVEGFCVMVIVAAFALVAIEILLLFARAYLTLGAGVMVLGFGANRFTSSAAEGYFTNVIRVSVKLLFYYLVLGVGMQMVAQWQTAIAAVCAPVPTTVGLLGSYYVPPTAIATTVCSGSLSISDLLGYAVYAAVFASIVVAVPIMASELVGGALGLALMHAFEAAYIASKVISPVSSAAKAVTGAASSAVSSNNKTANNTDSPGVQAAMASAASKANSSGATQQQPPSAATSPFNGQQPGYNVRNGNAVTASPGAAQNSGPGQLTYQPGKPGQHTKDIAVDVTDIQNRNGNGEDNDPP
jgi:P-type conjugative transfer protein TrbL